MTSGAPTNVGKRITSNIASASNQQYTNDSNDLLIGPSDVARYDVT